MTHKQTTQSNVLQDQPGYTCLAGTVSQLSQCTQEQFLLLFVQSIQSIPTHWLPVATAAKGVWRASILCGNVNERSGTPHGLLTVRVFFTTILFAHTMSHTPCWLQTTPTICPSTLTAGLQSSKWKESRQRKRESIANTSVPQVRCT